MNTLMSPKSDTRLFVVDGLRAIAIVAVVLYHGFPTFVKGGFVGVDIFFVISGFVIALRYLEPMVAREIHFSTFFLRRIRRLVPAYLALLIVTTAFAIWILKPSTLMNYGESLLSQGVYAQNVAFWHIGDYFDDALAKPLLHTWSLAIEEQFYFCFPVAILLLRWRRRPALILLALSALASIALGNRIEHISPKTSFYWLPFRAWEFLTGIFAAYLFQRNGLRVSIGVGSTLLTVGTVAILFAILGFDESAIFPGAQTLIAVAGTMAICLFQEQAVAWMRTAFINPLAQHWGRISYSWYLWHWPPLSFYFVLTGHRAGLGAAALITILGYALGAVSYRLLERWGLRTTMLQSPRAAFGLFLGFLGFAGVTGAFLVMGRGLIERYPARERPLLAAQLDIASYRCPLLRRLALWDEEICQINDAKGAGGVLIMGDSHADLAKGVIAALGGKADAPVYLVKQNCRFIDYGVARQCPMSQWSQIMRDVRRHRIDKLVLISFWPHLFRAENFVPAFRRVSSSGLHIYLQQSVPDSPDLDPGGYLAHSDDWSTLSRYTLQDHESLRRDQEKLFDSFAAADPHVTILDPVPLLCGSGRCAFSRNGRPLYLDTNHLTTAGVAVIEPIYEGIFR